MSVRKNPGSPYWQYRFQLGGVEYHGPTGCTSEREAKSVEKAARDKARSEQKRVRSGPAGLTIGAAALLFYTEVGQFQANPDTVVTDFARIADFLGKDKLLTDVSNHDVMQLMAWRRGHKAIKGGRPSDDFVSAATVNRSTLQRLQKLFTHAKDNWDMRFDNEPKWKGKKLREPPERVRELHGDESDKLDAETRDDYAPIFEYIRASGQRQRECLLRWSEVDWNARLITRLGKGGRRMVVPITDAIRQILWPLRGHHPEFVFTYVAARTRDGRVEGERYPVTLQGFKTTWRRLRKRAGVSGFRMHDFRHDFATKAMRNGTNQKVVSQLLNHADIKTTSKYVHVTNADLAVAAATVQAPRQKLAGKLAGRARHVA